MSGRISFEVFEGAQSLGRAQLGDLSVLLDRLRSESPLLREERQFLADLLEGRCKLPPNHPTQLATELRDDDLVESFLIEKAVAIAPKVAERVACKFGITTTHLHRIHRRLRDDAPRYAKLSKSVDRQVKDYFRALDAYNQERRWTVQMRWDERRERRLPIAKVT